MVRWLRWHCPPDTGFEIRALAVWGRARYFSVTEAPHNTDFHTWMGKKHFCFFQTTETGNRTPNSGVKGSGANHYPRAPALFNLTTPLNHVSPHDALKHHFASRKNELIFRNLVVFERKLAWNCFENNSIFFNLSPTSSHYHPLQVENCDSNSRLVVDEDDNG